MKMTVSQNFEKPRKPKTVVLASGFAGVKAGLLLYIGTPQIIADYISKIPFGESCSIEKLRHQLARRNNCDAMCPVSTAIFLRITADFAIEQLSAGKNVESVVPFWRVLTAKDKITAKLKIEPAWLERQRQLEKIEIKP
jgi:6-O-methylguanine DNA methyltransferase, DNA binding domain